MNENSQVGRKRENSFDLLRIISCIGVIFIHAASRYPGKLGGGIVGR